MCSGLETVLLLFRGLTGSYSHLKPRSRHRSHWGRSSLHFFFFSLLNQSQHIMMVAGGSERLTYQCTHPVRKQQHQRSASCFSNRTAQRLRRNGGKVHECLPALERLLGILAGTGLW